MEQDTRLVDYPEDFIRTKDIKIWKRKWGGKIDSRYLLFLPLRSSKKRIDFKRCKYITFIMKNPSAANKTKSDMTIRKVIEYIRAQILYGGLTGVEGIAILNIFPVYDKIARNLNDLLPEYEEIMSTEVNGEDELNDKIIRTITKHSTWIVIATGGSRGIKSERYRKRVQSLYKSIFHILTKPSNRKKPILFRIKDSNGKYTFHPQGIGYSSYEKLYKYRLREATIKLNRTNNYTCKLKENGITYPEKKTKRKGLHS